MKPLVIIPARGGSKGLPGKNIKPLNGKPLIHYTIDAARQVFPDERICISTDSDEIIRVVESIGINVPFIRPTSIASDTASSEDVLLHAINFYDKKGLEFDTIVLLQATSPLRNSVHIEEAVKLYSSQLDMLVSVKETDANPYYVLKEENSQGYLQPSKAGTFTRRQDCPKVYELNGAIYLINRQAFVEKGFSEFTKIKKYLMDKRSSVDIDDIIDFQLAELLIRDGNEQ